MDVKRRHVPEYRRSWPCGGSYLIVSRILAFSPERRETAPMTAPFDPEYVFSHHGQTPAKLAHYDAIHTGAKQFAEVILAHTPRCEDQAAALRLLRESAMIACAAVALGGRLTK
jgi:hypothetical protein